VTDDEAPVATPGAAGFTAGMPRWVLRAIITFWAGLVLLWVLRGVLHALRGFLVTLLVSLFLSFAIEPAVNALARRGWRRGAATGLVFVALLLASSVFTFAIGSLVVNQVRDFADEAPEYLDRIEEWVNERFDADIDFQDLGQRIQESNLLDSVGSKALEFGLTALGVVFQLLTIALFTFYLVADGPRLRRAICSRLPPDRQAQVLRGWELAIDKTGSYLYSRLLLAVLSASAHWIALSIIGVPYPLALAAWVGVVSQFVPVVGTYIAGALAVLVALINDPIDGLLVLAVVVVYQQVENYLFAPRVTAHTLSLHPAIAFGGVVVGASLLGPVGALLALPAAAVFQAFASSFGARHDVIESELLAEPTARAARHRTFRLSRRGR
jgi:predicted PurR-regulated permease PerM